MTKHAVFSGLIIDERGQTVETAYIGDTPCYVIIDAGFRRHVEAEKIDQQVLKLLYEHVINNRELVTQGLLNFMGQDDLFTKAMIDASIQNMDQNIAQIAEHGLPEDARTWMGMLGFQVVVNLHGEVVHLESPRVIDEEE